jgi:A/G-specific adenine glycosylase
VKLAKKGPRLETVAVCIVEREKEGGKGEKEYLLVRRPNTGLLAGLWEVPSVIVKESKESKEEDEEDEEEEEEKSRKRKKGKKGKGGETEVSEAEMHEKINEYLHGEVKMSGYKVVERARVGEVVHVFSHIKQTLNVECIFDSKYFFIYCFFEKQHLFCFVFFAFFFDKCRYGCIGRHKDGEHNKEEGRK